MTQASRSRADRLEKDGVGVTVEKCRAMAKEAGRAPASLPAEKKDKLMPIIDRWAEAKQQPGG